MRALSLLLLTLIAFAGGIDYTKKKRSGKKLPTRVICSGKCSHHPNRNCTRLATHDGSCLCLPCRLAGKK